MNSARGCIYLIALIYLPLTGYDNAHFYRATPFFGDPRLERSTLTSVDLSVGARSTRKARNGCGNSIALFDLYGTHNMHQLGAGVPDKDPANNPLDLILTLLEAIPARDNFATFSIEGSFQFIEANLIFTQNICNGFFTHVHLPVINLHVRRACFNDLSPTDTEFPNINTPEWQNFLANFDAILTRYSLSKKATDHTDVGDLALSLGWARSYQDTTEIDFIDVTFKAGVLIPTGKEKNENQIFSIPTGYNGHFGFPLSVDMAIGMCEWLTFGGHVEVIPFGRKTKTIRLKTADSQSGIITLAKGRAKVDHGTMLTGGVFILADHCVRGLSFVLGYSYARKGENTVRPCDSCFDIATVSNDEIHKRWIMHTINARVEYNFAKQGCSTGLRVGIFYDWNAGGERTFQTDKAGACAGLDMVWDF